MSGYEFICYLLGGQGWLENWDGVNTVWFPLQETTLKKHSIKTTCNPCIKI